jgi:predicted DNA-binding transcriptional regulator AlpA
METSETAINDTNRRTPAAVRASDYDERSELVAEKYLPLLDGLSKVTRWRLRKRGLYPAPIRISDGRVAWHRTDVVAWREAKRQTK